MTFSKEFRRAILQGTPLESFITLLERYTDFNSALRGGEPDSPIHLAVLNDRLDVVKLLVQKGASLEPLEIYPKAENPYPEFQEFEIDDDRFTRDPLITAASQGKQEIFNFLAPLASSNQRKRATLYLADGIKRHSISNAEDETTFQQLSNTRPNTNDSEAFGQWLTSLAKSTIVELDPRDILRTKSTQFAEKCQTQISQRLDIDHIGDNGCTFLWTAAHNSYVEAVRVLIELGASVNIPNQTDGWTPLMIAVDAHIPWTFGTKTAWGIAASRQVEIINLLLQANANVNAQGNDGETALMLTSRYDQDDNYEEETLSTAIHEVVNILRDAGATDNN